MHARMDALREWGRVASNPVRPEAKGRAKERLRFVAGSPVGRAGSGVELALPSCAPHLPPSCVCVCVCAYIYMCVCL